MRMRCNKETQKKEVIMENKGDVRKAVAEYPNIPTEVLDRLATEQNMDVRRAVAENPNTPPDDLAKLATH
jgi:hypothetical protein